MNANETKLSLKKMMRAAILLGIFGWVVGFFGLYMALPSGVYAIFVVLSAILLAIFLKIKAMGEDAPGAPKKIYLTLGIVFFAVQILFFGAVTICGLEALPWASRLFFTITGLYLMPPFTALMNKR